MNNSFIEISSVKSMHKQIACLQATLLSEDTTVLY